MRTIKNRNIKCHIVNIILAFLVLSSIGIASANPGIVVRVMPDSIGAEQGDTITYQVETESITDMTEHVKLSIQNPTADWNYVFDNPEFDIGPGEKITTNLHVTIPTDASGTMYQSDVLGTGAVPGLEEFTTETSFFTFITAIPPVPEQSTMTLVGLGMLGLILIVRREK